MASEEYAAFISYSHADEQLARWLHRKLESYNIPASIARRSYGKRRLGRVFRDRVELGASHDLGVVIRNALDRSRALIVLCSPPSAKSHYVNEEIRYFKSLGRSEQILAAIVPGEPHAVGKEIDGRLLSEDDECFPRALLYRLGDGLQIHLRDAMGGEMIRKLTGVAVISPYL